MHIEKSQPGVGQHDIAVLRLSDTLDTYLLLDGHIIMDAEIQSGDDAGMIQLTATRLSHMHRSPVRYIDAELGELIPLDHDPLADNPEDGRDMEQEWDADDLLSALHKKHLVFGEFMSDAEYVRRKGNDCPRCRENELDPGPLEDIDGGAKITITCHVCDLQFDELLKRDTLGDALDDGTPTVALPEAS